MGKKVFSAVLVFLMLCLSLAVCGCDASAPTNDTASVIDEEYGIDVLMDNFIDAINRHDEEQYNSLITDKMKSSNNDINTYFNKISGFSVETIAYDGRTQDGEKLNILIHYHVAFSDEYKGTQYKVGENNVSNTFTFVKEGYNYKIDSINYYK